MKQKEEIAVQQEMLNQQRDKVNANHLELARQSNHVRANEKVIQSQKEKIEQQERKNCGNRIQDLRFFLFHLIYHQEGRNNETNCKNPLCGNPDSQCFLYPGMCSKRGCGKCHRGDMGGGFRTDKSSRK